MRLLVTFLVIIGIAGGCLWYFVIRETPEKLFAQALHNFSTDRGVENVQASVYWDKVDASGRGFILDTWVSYTGSLNLEDHTRPTGAGILSVSHTVKREDFQTADVHLTDDIFSFKLREAEAFRSWLEWWTATSSEQTWYSFDRDTLLKKKGFGSWIAVGDGSDIRTALSGVDVSDWGFVKSSKIYRSPEGKRLVGMEVRLDSEEMSSDLLSLIVSWMLRDPSAQEIDWARRVGQGASQGNWSVLIDSKSKRFVSIQGYWPLVDSDNVIIGHVTVDARFTGAGRIPSIQPITESFDATRLLTSDETKTFPSAKERDEETVDSETSTSRMSSDGASDTIIDSMTGSEE